MWFIIRHGQTLENKLGIHQGQIDSLLSLKGIVQSQSIGYRLLDFKENFDEYEFISSPLIRTKHTLQIIMEILNTKEKNIKIESLLVNRNKGILQGIAKSELKKEYPIEYEKMIKDSWNYIPPQATESKYDSYKRVLNFIEKYKNHKNIVIVSHGSITKMLREILSGMTIEQIMVLDKDLSKNQNYFYCWNGNKIEKI